MMLKLAPLRCCLIALALLLAPPCFANRVALVIGNAAYEGQKPLRNPGNDAQDVATKLSAMQFNGGRVQPLTNLKRKAINDAVREFVNQAAGAEMAMVYYSGHGMQAAGETYLIPTDAQINSEYDVASEGLPLSRIMGELQAKGVRRTVIVLDACRDNPYATGKKGGPRGLAPPREMSSAYLVAYATADGKTADDGKGRNGTYTAELLRFLDQPGKNLRDVLEDTQLAVEESSKGAQVPKIYGDTAKFRDVFLRPGRPNATPPMQIASVVPEPVPVPVPRPPPTAQAPSPGQTMKDCADCPELVVIPAGSFTMGSSAAEQALAKDGGLPDSVLSRESPQHQVMVRSFAAGKYAVTKGEFAAFVRAKGYQTEAETGDGCYGWTSSEWKKDKAYNWRNVGFAQADDHPVVCVSWNDAQAYLQWLNQTSGKTYRLLSEAEREYAARAGSQSAYWWGDSINTSQANYDGTGKSYNNSPQGEWRRATVPVSSFKANPFGLYNVHGNVWEWVEDCFHDNYNGAPSDGSAWTTGCSGNFRVLRGGSWYNYPAYLRSAIRGRFTPDFRNNLIGFRLARTLLTP